MVGHTIKILFHKDQAYLSNDKALGLKQLGLPQFAKEFIEDAYWVIRVLKKNDTPPKIFCEIIDYKIGFTEFNNNQILLYEELRVIEEISFRTIDTIKLAKCLVKNERTRFVQNYKDDERYEVFGDLDNFVEKTHLDEFKQNVIYISETFTVPLKKVRFKLGAATFSKKFKRHPKTIELEIPNYEIREEFDAVKNYFANALKTKKIGVHATITIKNNQVVAAKLLSPEISRINKEMIDDVKFEFVKDIVKKKPNFNVDKSLFTMDEYFDSFADEKFQSNTFHKNEQDLFDDLLHISKTKHYKHLRYLSSIHAYHIMKLRFVHKPMSFLFLVEGECNYHIIWETLDTTEATYVWHIAKNLDLLKTTLRKIEHIINVIKVQGRIAYLNSHDDPFRRIKHDYSELIDGFIKWKGSIESYLT